MANQKLSALAISSPRGTPDRANDVIYVEKAGVSYGSTVNNELGISGNPVGDTDSQTLTNKTLTSPAISGPTLSGTLTGTYTLGGTPTFPASVVTLTGSQTLTNKVLTSPTISSPTITNASITADAITGFTNANNGTIYGIAVTSSQIGSAALVSGAITYPKLGTDSSFATTDISGTATIVGWSTFTIKQLRYKQIGKLVYIFYDLEGTSNSTGTSFTVPVSPSTNLTNYEGVSGLHIDNGGIGTQPRWNLSSGGNAVNFYTSFGGGGWTASGGKTIRGIITYEAA